MAGGFKNIFISNQQRQVKLDKAWLQTLLGRIVAKTKYSDWELYCRLVGPKRMTLLNKQLRGKETTTDILSLPLHAVSFVLSNGVFIKCLGSKTRSIASTNDTRVKSVGRVDYLSRLFL